MATGDPKRITVRSPFLRAVLPVFGGVAVIGLLALVLWGFAAYISRDGTATSERLAPSTLRVGSVQSSADLVAENGPIIFPGLGTTTGERTLVLNHTGDDPADGWVVYFAYPAGGDPDCAVEQVRVEDIGTDEFTDCNGNILDVTELAPPPEGVNPVVENERLLSIDLSGVTTETVNS